VDKLLKLLRGWRGHLTGKGHGRRTRDAIRADLEATFPPQGEEDARKRRVAGKNRRRRTLDD
jgi:hypothetical protein